MSHFFISAIAIAIGYVFGSINTAVIVSRAFNLPNPRLKGSKNPGATNILRLGGKKYAIMVLIFDALKGAIPVIIAKILPVSDLVVFYTCLAAVLGHMFPVFFSFWGGKGVATAIGGLLAVQFILGSMVIGIWVLVAHFTRYASLASLVSMTAMPLLGIWITNHMIFFPPLFFITLFIFFKHANNITRLLNGDESKISFAQASSSQHSDRSEKKSDKKTPRKTSRSKTKNNDDIKKQKKS